MEKEKTALVDKSEDYQKGYYDGYHKGYSDKKSAINKAKKEAKAEYVEKLQNLSVHTIYPFNVVYDIIEDHNTEQLLCFSPELIMKTIAETLSVRESDILLSHYRDKQTYNEIASKYGITGSRIQQIEYRALRKLRHPKAFNSMRAVSYNKYKDLEVRYNALEYAYNNSPNPKDIQDVINETSIEGTPIIELELSVRSYNCLLRAGIKTVGDLINKTEWEILHIRNLGRRSLFEIKQKLAEMGLGFKHEDLKDE